MSELTDRLREEGLGWGIGPAGLCQEAAETIDRMEARIAELEGALRPFAEVGQGETHFYILPETLEAARRALSEGEG